jgi:hypothetical protein
MISGDGIVHSLRPFAPGWLAPGHGSLVMDFVIFFLGECVKSGPDALAAVQNLR